MEAVSKRIEMIDLGRRWDGGLRRIFMCLAIGAYVIGHLSLIDVNNKAYDLVVHIWTLSKNK